MITAYDTQNIKSDIYDDLKAMNKNPENVKDIKLLIEMEDGQNIIRTIGGLS